MEFSPKTTPLFGGGVIKVILNPELLKHETPENLSTEYFLLIEGQDITHFSYMKPESQDSFVATIPEHSIPEKVSLQIFQAIFDKSNQVEPQISKIAETFTFLEYINDQVKETTQEIISDLFDISLIHKNLKSLYDNHFQLEFIDDQTDNFDRKIYFYLRFFLNLRPSDVENKVPLIKNNKFQSSYDELMEYLERKSLSSTLEFFKILCGCPDDHVLLLLTDDDPLFLYPVDTDVSESRKIREGVYLREYSAGTCTLSACSFNFDITPRHQILMLLELRGDISPNDTHTSTPESLEPRSRSQTIELPLSSTSKEPDGNIDTIVAPVVIPPSEDACSNPPDPLTSGISIRKSQTFRNNVGQRPIICIKHDQPLKHSASKESEFGSIDQRRSLTHSVSSSATGIGESRKQDEIDNLFPETFRNRSTTTIKSNDNSDSYKSNESTNEISMSEFLEREINNINKDTSFKGVAVKIHDEKKGLLKRIGITGIFRKDKRRASLSKTLNPDISDALILKSPNKSSLSHNSLESDISRTKSSSSPASKLEATDEDQPEDSQNDFISNTETWSSRADPKMLKKLSTKEIKRQDVIYELIKTEHGYVKTLKTVHQVYYNGFLQKLKLPRKTVENLVPKVSELFALHGNFLAHMIRQQNQNESYFVQNISDSCIQQFSGICGSTMVEIYSFVCSRQSESVALYKELLKNDKRFSDFVEACGNFQLLRRLSLPECLTFITQRISKYPLLIEAVLKNTKETDKEYHTLCESLRLVKNLVTQVNIRVKLNDNEKLLKSIIAKIDNKCEIIIKPGAKIRLPDVFPTDCVLVQTVSCQIKCKTRTQDTMIVALETHVVFLQEKDQKYYFCQIDQKIPFLCYKNLMVRTVATDLKALFVVDKGNAEIYELVFNTAKECSGWLNHITLYSSKNSDSNISIEQFVTKSSTSQAKDSVDEKDIKNFYDIVVQKINNISSSHLKILQQLGTIRNQLNTKENHSSSLSNLTLSVQSSSPLEQESKSSSSNQLQNFEGNKSIVASTVEELLKLSVESLADNTCSSSSIGSRSRTKTTIDANLPPIKTPPPHVKGQSAFRNVTLIKTGSKILNDQALRGIWVNCRTLSTSIMESLSREEKYLGIIRNQMFDASKNSNLSDSISTFVLSLNTQVNCTLDDITAWKTFFGNFLAKLQNVLLSGDSQKKLTSRDANEYYNMLVLVHKKMQFSSYEVHKIEKKNSSNEA